MNTLLDEIEHSLQRCWDPDVLGVYADVLIASGDLRGELIALDVAIACGDQSLEVHELREARVQAWLDDVVGEPSLTCSNVRSPNLTELVLDGDQVMITPGHPGVTTLRITGGRSIVAGREPMSAITEIDLQFERPLLSSSARRA